ncbi:MAG: hypothetical protein CR986_00285 [Ignavibacteriae bacterium]|nr:MAG: hypothetical protein CR986_00285 [Ignavibacteriota bacterium]
MNKIFQFVFFILYLTLTINIFAQSNVSDDNQLKLAKFFETQNNYAEAEKIYSKLYKKNPKDFNFYSSYYNSLISQKKYDAAKTLVNKQLKTSTNKINIICDLGEVYYLTGDEKKANEIWDSALEIDSNDPFSYKIVSEYLIKHRNIDRAIITLQKGNTISKNPIIFSHDVAHLFSITMQFDKAAEEYCKILSESPKQIHIVRMRISNYINSPNAKEITLNILRDFCEEENKIEFYELLKDLYFQANEFEEAFDIVLRIEEIRENNGSDIFNFANNASSLNKHKIAIDAYEYFIENYPNSPLISQSEINIISEKEKELNNKSLSNEDWKPLTINKNSINEYKELIASYQKIVTKYPNTTYEKEANYRIAEIYLNQLNDVNKADSILTKLIGTNKNFSAYNNAEYLISQVALEKNELSKAENILQKLSTKLYTTPEGKNKILFSLAKTKMWQGKFTEAISLFNELANNTKDKNVNDALQYSLIISTFKSDSTNLFFFINSDYLIEKRNFTEALTSLSKISENENLFILKDYAAIKYAEILIALDKYEEAGKFLEKKLNSDKDNIFLDRYLYLLGSNYFYGKKDKKNALIYLTRVIDEFQNSFYYNKARTLISKINTEIVKTL